jgi:hypothetical protein
VKSFDGCPEFWHRTVDTDYGGYFHTVDGESLWREDRVSALNGSAPDELTIPVARVADIVLDRVAAR